MYSFVNHLLFCYLQETHYYYKDVSCSQMQVVEQELERLLPGKQSSVLDPDLNSDQRNDVCFGGLQIEAKGRSQPICCFVTSRELILLITLYFYP